MNSESENQINGLNFDIEQWRSDIRTFAETTGKALDAIISELSRSCSGATDIPLQSKSCFAADTPYQRNVQPIESAPPSDPSRGDGRLAQLESQLADRIAAMSHGGRQR